MFSRHPINFTPESRFCDCTTLVEQTFQNVLSKAETVMDESLFPLHCMAMTRHRMVLVGIEPWGSQKLVSSAPCQGIMLDLIGLAQEARAWPFLEPTFSFTNAYFNFHIMVYPSLTTGDVTTFYLFALLKLLTLPLQPQLTIPSWDPCPVFQSLLKVAPIPGWICHSYATQQLLQHPEATDPRGTSQGWCPRKMCAAPWEVCSGRPSRRCQQHMEHWLDRQEKQIRTQIPLLLHNSLQLIWLLSHAPWPCPD